MPTNPFKPPETDSSRNPQPAGPGTPVKAVLFGLAVDIGGSMLVGFVTAVLYAVQLKAQGVADSDIREAMAHMPHDSALYMASMLFGIALSVLGGFVCARIAHRDEYRPGLILAVISLVFSLLVGSTDDESSRMAFLMLASSFACNLLGVKFGVDVNRRGDPGKDAPTP